VSRAGKVRDAMSSTELHVTAPGAAGSEVAAVCSTADAYLELLAARGVERLFGNGGTDFGPIIDAYAKRMANGQPVPDPITVPHEITAVAMAHGYAMLTRRPQAVMVHTIAGTANATGNIINAARSNVPVLFTAGRTPLAEHGGRASRNAHIHWAQESFDQGGMVREWVKWDYELRHGSDVEGVVDRALAIAQSEPQGPVYLSLPREVLAEDRESLRYARRPRMKPVTAAAAPEEIDAATRALAEARNPIVITGALGRDPAAIPQLIRLAELLNAPVFDTVSPLYANFPTTHRLHQGSDVRAALELADVVLVVEADVPWIPAAGSPAESATVIAAAPDPLYTRYPIRGFPADVALAGAPRHSLGAVADGLAAERLDDAAIEERGRRWAAEHERVRAGVRSRAAAARSQRPLHRAWVSHCLEQLRDDDTIILNELGFDTSQFELDQPDTYFGVSTAGVLGWGVGAALGAKLAAPEKTVVCGVGEGSYIFGAPEAGHWLSRRLSLPVLYVVWNNSEWAAVSQATRAVYPDGWAVRTGAGPFSDLSPSLDFEAICRSAGGYGERVEDPEQVPAALERALHAVKVEGRQALLNVVGSSER
jgi:acetolactate synthase I/II/III large subunit